ncbi:hypothetical protein [Sporosarcina sp. G11-34]|uniref:hypothetical protein n=1 Tax=Sporosarcina sp. G11-34 TaxID=2849605 RepID=UPI0022A8E575|nr:hypothetical protein [Sporosarcina sp. G11-34]MCZ2260096.1 hypothetical protein [Sporosarcina sp. G11-34]
MFNKTFVYTSIFGALSMAFALKFLQFFNFISWSPVGWSKRWKIFPSNHVMHYIANWLLLILALTVLFAIVYILTSHLYKIPPSVSAILISIIFVFVTEWFISKPNTFLDLIRSLSVPLLALAAIYFRFIVGTAVYMKEISNENTK